MTENNKTLFRTDFIIEDEITDKDNHKILLTTTFYSEVDATALSESELEKYKQNDIKIVETKTSKLTDYNKLNESNFSRDDSSKIPTVFESESWIKKDS